MSFSALTSDLQPLWSRYEMLYQKQQVPKAMLLVCPEDCSGVSLIDKIQARVLCSAEQGPCGQCRDCYLFQEQTHPDLYRVVSSQTADTIKLDAVRLLQDNLFLSSQVAVRKLIYLEYLEHLTPAATHALLKTIEEPPEQVFFLGVTRQVGGILPTLLSRFQQWILPSVTIESVSYLSPSRWTFKSSGFLELIQQISQLVSELTDCMQGSISSVVLAEKWSAYSLQDLFSVLYCLFAESMRVSHMGLLSEHRGLFEQLSSWQCALILKKIEGVLAHLQRHPSIQALLTIEVWLMEVTDIARMV